MEGVDNNLNKSDISALEALEQQLYGAKPEKGAEGLTRASKAGVALLQNPKFGRYAETKGNPLQYKAKIKKQINQLQQQIQQAQLDSTSNPQEEEKQDGMAPIVAASAPAAAVDTAQNKEPDIREGEEGRMSEDEAMEEALKMQEMAKGADGKATSKDYQDASDKLDRERKENAEAHAFRPGEPTSRLSQDQAMDEAMKNGGSNAVPPSQSRQPAAEQIKQQTAPATKDKPAGEKGPQKPAVPGGEAVKPQGKVGQAIQGAKNLKNAGDQLAKKAGGKLAAAAASAAGLGALAGVADKIGQWATDKLLPFFKKYKFWLMTPTFLIIILLGSTTMGVAGALMQRDGRNGGTTGEYIDPSDPASISDINELLGQSYNLQGQPSDWYYKQNDPEWAGSDRGNMAHTLGSHGCVITSWAMIAKYNGLHVNPQNIAPGCNPNNRNCFKNWVASNLQAKKKVNMKWIDIRKDIQQIRAVLAKGYPVVAYGHGTFGSRGPHAVVIVGVTEKGVLVLNDPIRSSGHKWSFESDKIDWLTALVNK